MRVEFSELIGKTLVSIDRDDRNDSLTFTCSNGEQYRMFHYQNCCEAVYIEDICGDLSDLIGNPILIAEEVSNYKPESEEDKDKTKRANEYGDCQWTFYKLATIKGYVDIRWFGESNGYYSTSVDFVKANEDGTFPPWD